MSDELIEKVARAMCHSTMTFCGCGEVCRAPIKNLLEHNPIGEHARAAIAVVRAVAIEECAAVIRREMKGAFLCIGDDLIADIRALAKRDENETG